MYCQCEAAAGEAAGGAGAARDGMTQRVKACIDMQASWYNANIVPLKMGR